MISAGHNFNFRNLVLGHPFAPPAAGVLTIIPSAANKVLFLLEPTEITRLLARQRVTVIDYPDGRLAIRHNGVDLPYRTYDKLRRVTHAAIVENKRLSEALAWVKARQDELRPVRPKTNSEAGGYVARRRGRRGQMSFVDRHIAAKNAHPTAAAGAAPIPEVCAAPAEAP